MNKGEIRNNFERWMSRIRPQTRCHQFAALLVLGNLNKNVRATCKHEKLVNLFRDGEIVKSRAQ